MEAKLGRRSSWGWKGIIQGRRVLERGMIWRVGDGRCVRVSHDPWLPRPHTYRCFEEEGNLILGLPISLAGCKDRVIWHYSRNGDYTVRKGYGVAEKWRTW
ncbi:ribonuclease H protein [Pyrus ussuriensis x Pyrus communis]|uniref:Ribonuclease H protein n=1 Tax=Pyrus ussuriensis x Pyrus communis TaxID=2448454 RepID=A0A5N5F8T2_9ROSA|nr:ribonuclease H protein [Pyrus ussuriensis x Pyrus communis]